MSIQTNYIEDYKTEVEALIQQQLKEAQPKEQQLHGGSHSSAILILTKNIHQQISNKPKKKPEPRLYSGSFFMEV